jgi:hypothetical protein
VGCGFEFCMGQDKIELLHHQFINNKMTETLKKSMYGLDSSKYPAKMGKAWTEEEVVKLLDHVNKKKTLDSDFSIMLHNIPP